MSRLRFGARLMEKRPPSDARDLHCLDRDRGGGWACADRAERLRRLSARLLSIPAPVNQRSRHSSGASGRRRMAEVDREHSPDRGRGLPSEAACGSISRVSATRVAGNSATPTSFGGACCSRKPSADLPARQGWSDAGSTTARSLLAGERLRSRTNSIDSSPSQGAIFSSSVRRGASTALRLKPGSTWVARTRRRLEAP